MRRQDDERRGSILVQVTGQANGNPGTAGTGSVIYYRNEKITEEKNFLGEHLTQTASEYISIIMGIKATKRTFRHLDNKLIIINIKS